MSGCAVVPQRVKVGEAGHAVRAQHAAAVRLVDVAHQLEAVGARKVALLIGLIRAAAVPTGMRQILLQPELE